MAVLFVWSLASGHSSLAASDWYWLLIAARWGVDTGYLILDEGSRRKVQGKSRVGLCADHGLECAMNWIRRGKQKTEDRRQSFEFGIRNAECGKEKRTIRNSCAVRLDPYALNPLPSTLYLFVLAATSNQRHT
jgi:hypothetical protein